VSELSAAARDAKAAIERVLALLEWPGDERALSLALDRLVRLEEGE